MCDHDWKPVEGWFARYRCARCKAYGAKLAVLSPGDGKPAGITPLRCRHEDDEERGPGQAPRRCDGLAVARVRGEGLRCAQHAPHRRTHAARIERATHASAAVAERPSRKSTEGSVRIAGSHDCGE